MKTANSNECILSKEACYVLTASAYLHDIGLFSDDFLGRPSSELTENDFDEIRKKHPENTYQILKKNEVWSRGSNFPIGELAASNQYLEIIGLVCKGHGTEYFEEITKTGNIKESVNIPFLSSILMIADELDLTEERAVFNVNHNATSYLHNLKHCYISNVNISNLDNSDFKTRVHLTILPADANRVEKERKMLDVPVCENPDNVPHFVSNTPYNPDLHILIADWIGKKLICQINKTRDIFIKASKGKLEWAEASVSYEVNEDIKSNALRLFCSPDAEEKKNYINSYFMLKRLVEESKIVNRDSFKDWIKKLDEAKNTGEKIFFHMIYGNSRQDIEKLKDWTNYKFRELGKRVYEINITEDTSEQSLQFHLLKLFGKNFKFGIKKIEDIKAIAEYYKQAIACSNCGKEDVLFSFYYDCLKTPDVSPESLMKFIKVLNKKIANENSFSYNIYISVYALGGKKENFYLDIEEKDKESISVGEFDLNNFNEEDIDNYFNFNYAFIETETVKDIKEPEELYNFLPKIISLKKLEPLEKHVD